MQVHYYLYLLYQGIAFSLFFFNFMVHKVNSLKDIHLGSPETLFRTMLVSKGELTVKH